MNHPFALLALALALQVGTPALASETAASDGKTIVFVCLHGSVKSQMAAAHFNRIAKERGLPYTAISRGIEVDGSIPPRIREELKQEGLAPLNDVPQPLTAAEAAGAVKVVAFDTVPDKNRGAAEVNYWSDVPPTSKNYSALRDAIVHHIDDLVQETLQGKQ
jgi:protein-tyrosine-phosphatase